MFTLSVSKKGRHPRQLGCYLQYTNTTNVKHGRFVRVQKNK
jgi:hypothetical protein